MAEPSLEDSLVELWANESLAILNDNMVNAQQVMAHEIAHHWGVGYLQDNPQLLEPSYQRHPDPEIEVLIKWENQLCYKSQK